MILPFDKNHNQIKILIPTQSRFWASLFTTASFFLLLLLLIIISSQPSPLLPAAVEAPAMKVHPVPRKRNVTIQYASRGPLLSGFNPSHKKLRRLPHVFSRVLELPFRSDADVLVEESSDCFRFVAEADDIRSGVRAHAVEIHPGVTKIVVREAESVELTLDELELDVWRFRLPESTRPELASAVFAHGELVVTVPKAEGGGGGGQVWGDGNGGAGGFGGGMSNNRLVLVQ